MIKITQAKIAIVHDWLTVYGGAERVLEQVLACFPKADLFSVVDFLPEGRRGFILDKPVRTSFIQNLPFSRTKYRQFLSLMPLAVEQFDLSGYDLVLSCSHAVAISSFEQEAARILPVACRENALRFAPERFRAEFKACVEAEMERFRQSIEMASSKHGMP